MRLGGEVDDRVAARSGARDRLGIGDVGLDEPAVTALEIGGVPGVGELVEDDDLVAAREQALDEVGADEAGPAGDENLHGGEA